jgi:hypothetical protein
MHCKLVKTFTRVDNGKHRRGGSGSGRREDQIETKQASHAPPCATVFYPGPTFFGSASILASLRSTKNGRELQKAVRREVEVRWCLDRIPLSLIVTACTYRRLDRHAAGRNGRVRVRADVREPVICSTPNRWSRLAKQEQVEDEELGKERFDHVLRGASSHIARAVTLVLLGPRHEYPTDVLDLGRPPSGPRVPPGLHQLRLRLLLYQPCRPRHAPLQDADGRGKTARPHRWWALDDHAETTRPSCTSKIGDGLRADLLFNRNAFFDVVPDAPEFVAPHLRSIAQHRGAFGVSHTRVPTESRPGHVALIGMSSRRIQPPVMLTFLVAQVGCTRTSRQLRKYDPTPLRDVHI